MATLHGVGFGWRFMDQWLPRFPMFPNHGVLAWALTQLAIELLCTQREHGLRFFRYTNGCGCPVALAPLPGNFSRPMNWSALSNPPMRLRSEDLPASMPVLTWIFFLFFGSFSFFLLNCTRFARQ